MSSEPQKQCTQCAEWKLLEDFHRRVVGTFDGHYAECRKCHSKRTRQNYADRRDYYVSQKREYYANKRLQKHLNNT